MTRLEQEQARFEELVQKASKNDDEEYDMEDEDSDEDEEDEPKKKSKKGKPPFWK